MEISFIVEESTMAVYFGFWFLLYLVVYSWLADK